MKKILLIILSVAAFQLYGQQPEQILTTGKAESETIQEDGFEWQTEQFADLGILRYTIPGWEKLSGNQKALVYYLTQAGYSGRDIIYDQNYRHNLEIRKALENIVINYKGSRTGNDWNNFLVYTKRVWFSNGIHHHYSMDKIMPEFPKDYFKTLVKETNTKISEDVVAIMFDPDLDNKKVNLDSKGDLLLTSASNFYGVDVSQKDAEDYYAKRIDKNDERAISYGLNSQLVKTPNGIEERVWTAEGMYGSAIKQIIYWLEKAVTVAENPQQAKALNLLISYYKTGDLKTWDEYNIEWVKETEGDIDYINSFIEVYNDPLGYRGSFESIVELKDFEASERMKTLSLHAQWFEDNAPLMQEHKKEKVVGVSYKVVNVAGEAGDASPATPIGVNLPNANWIRAEYGSKSVSLGNIGYAYEQAGSSGMLDEFCYSEEEKERAKKFGSISGKMHTAMHEVIGHASGKINPGIGSPKETLKNYANTLEEARADLVGLYYIMDPKLVEWGLIPDIAVGMTQYDSYIRNGLMVQLRRIEPGKTVEESHMRNRQMIAAWVYAKGKSSNVIERKYENGKTYFVVNDYQALRKLFGDLLREVQRIKSEGDYKAGMELVENYGVQVDEEIHKEVLARSEKLNIPPYFGFINPMLTPVTDAKGNVIDVTVSYPEDFMEQMLYYGSKYSFLQPGSGK